MTEQDVRIFLEMGKRVSTALYELAEAVEWAWHMAQEQHELEQAADEVENAG